MPPSDNAFIVGTDLVEFDRRDLPIYATPESQWAAAGRDVAGFGAPLDRLFGEPGEVFVSGELSAPALSAATATPSADDPLVELGGLNDGLTLSALDHDVAPAGAAHHPPEVAVVCDFGDGLHPPDLRHDLWSFDSHG